LTDDDLVTDAVLCHCNHVVNARQRIDLVPELVVSETSPI